MAARAKDETTPEAVARAYFAAIAERDVERMMGFWEPGGYGHLYGMAKLRAPEGYREWFGNLFRAFPNFLFEVTDVVADAEKAAVRWRATGTFDGPVRFEGLAPTGASIELEGLDLLTIRDGLIRENRAYTNATEMARQMGAMPPAGSPGERAMLGMVNARTAATGAAKRLLRRD
jgi:predicted ester cyclase